MDFKNIEKKWQDKWDEAKCFEASNNSDKDKKRIKRHYLLLLYLAAFFH